MRTQRETNKFFHIMQILWRHRALFLCPPYVCKRRCLCRDTALRRTGYIAGRLRNIFFGNIVSKFGVGHRLTWNRLFVYWTFFVVFLSQSRIMPWFHQQNYLSNPPQVINQHSCWCLRLSFWQSYKINHKTRRQSFSFHCTVLWCWKG